jgi:hypothetical protein
MYDGHSDPKQFFMSYEATISSYGGNMAIMAKSFIMVVLSVAQTWYSSLRPGTITSWQKLKDIVGVSTPGVPGPTSKLSPRVPAQMGRRETEHKGGKKETGKKGKPTAFVLSCAQVGCTCSRGLQASAWEREREREAYTRRPVLPCGQPFRTRALDLPFIGVRRGPRCTMGDVAVC